jgi:hypothetical protein
MWSAICHSCLWNVKHRQREAVHATGGKASNYLPPEHLGAVEWQVST